MPTYVYKFVDSGETIEVRQSFADDTLTEAAHPTSGEVMPVKKVFQPVGVTFKGSGFFKTDNRGSKSSGERSSATSDGGGSSKTDGPGSGSGSGSSSSGGDSGGSKSNDSSGGSSGSGSSGSGSGSGSSSGSASASGSKSSSTASSD